jgi:hypothetical protein
MFNKPLTLYLVRALSATFCWRGGFLSEMPYNTARLWTVIGEPSAMNAERGG